MKMENSENILKKQINNGFAYALLLIIGLIIVFSMISYIKAKVEDISNGYMISESN